MAKANLKVVSDETVQTDENLRFAHLPISELRASADNRKVGDVSDLVASIKEIGVIQPITVTPIKAGYQIVFGHRRVEAAKKAGLTEIPAIVREVSERERLEQSLIENLQREDLTPYEEALTYERLLQLKDGPSQRQLATLIAKSQSHISKRLQLLKLPESVIEKLDSGGITIEDAMALAELADVAPPEEVEAVLGEDPYDIPSHVDR